MTIFKKRILKGEKMLLSIVEIKIHLELITRDASKVRSHCFDLEKYAATKHEI